MKNAIIYHNPKCSKSRAALEMLKEKGYTAKVILYLETPPSEDTLTQLLVEMNLSARELLRTNELPYKRYHLDNPELTEAQLIQAMIQHPILINRPIVKTENGTRLGRPLEQIEIIL